VPGGTFTNQVPVTPKECSMNTMNTIRSFLYGMCGAVTTAARPDEYLEVDQSTGRIKVEGIPEGFCLVIGKPKGSQIVITVKNTGEEIGGYNPANVTRLGGHDGADFSVIMKIAVKKVYDRNKVLQFVHTEWHKERPNCASVYVFESVAGKLTGKFANYQIGVITPDNGHTWLLCGEHRYKGQIFSQNGSFVVKPLSPKYGPFVTWMPIFKHPEVRRLLRDANIQEWAGKPTDLDPPLPKAATDNEAVVQWSSMFAGTGRRFGYAWLAGQREAVVVLGQFQKDSSYTPQRGDVVRFDKKEVFGTKGEDGPRAITNFRLERRTWE